MAKYTYLGDDGKLAWPMQRFWETNMAVAQAFEFIQTEDSKKKLSCAERTTFRSPDSGQGTENLQDGSNLKLNALDYNNGIVKDTFDTFVMKYQHNIK